MGGGGGYHVQPSHGTMLRQRIRKYERIGGDGRWGIRMGKGVGSLVRAHTHDCTDELWYLSGVAQVGK